MGHARSYITFDIIRRILTGYFGFDVLFVQNVTDIDDKIIRRARQQHLFSKYCADVESGTITSDQVVSQVRDQMSRLEQSILTEQSPEKKVMLQKVASDAGRALADRKDISMKDFLDRSREVVIQFLDTSAASSGSFPNEIFSSLPQFFEEDYNKDMESLNILRPNVVTRVSEYVPEIISYIDVIIKNGYAYVSSGSVYFDVAQFSSSPKHMYAKLVHEAVGDMAALVEGEGDLFSSSTAASDKKNPADFVLWKKSKPGEPVWPSPWGEGRPGWHIECSVMASAILGHEIDIHSGGCDLRFPHHDNEIAQAEAYYDTGRNWINFFIHSGHLNIDGQKMSKSLKNFTTIKEALQTHTKRQLRLAFLLHHWKDTLNYSPDTMAGALSDEKYFSEFFLNTKEFVLKAGQRFRKWDSAEISLKDALLEAQDRVDSALRDNIDTKTALIALKDLVKSCNHYLKDIASPHPQLLYDIVAYVSRILTIFGVMDGSGQGMDFESASASSGASDDVLRPVLRILANFRHVVRNECKSGGDIRKILEECDRVRDSDLWEQGIRLEDREAGEPVIKLVGRETLIRERMEKMRLEEAKLKEKEERRKEQEERDALSRIPASEWAKTAFPAERFSRFDERGIPTHDSEGNELSKGQRKKHLKDYENQDRRYQKHMSGKTN
jgi:cysteinyl-tRNA synthetase